MKILVAVDQLGLPADLREALVTWGYEAVSAGDGDEALRLLSGSDPPSLALLDRALAGLDALEVCRAVRKLREVPYVYLLLLVDRGEPPDVIACFEAGADAYLFKPFDRAELHARLSAARRFLELHEQLLRDQESLRHLATHDALTGLRNRFSTLETLQRELARIQREGGSVGVILVDVDHFKQVNDGYGHLVGDVVLRELSRRLRKVLRPYDTIGRYGGEEFLIILPNCEPPQLLQLGERLRRCVGDAAVNVPEARLPVTVSVGAAACGPAAGLDADALFRLADTALYVAKERGRNRVELCTPAPDPPAG